MPIHRSTVLVVEDDALINMTTVDTIRDYGYFALSAASADEALLILPAHPEIDVLFTDIRMPGSIDGLALARLTRRDYPLIDIVSLPEPTPTGTKCRPGRRFCPSRTAPSRLPTPSTHSWSRSFRWPARAPTNAAHQTRIENDMAIARIDDLKQRIRDALYSSDFQATASGLTGASLTAAVTRLFKRRHIAATLISVQPADKAALADFSVVWKIPATLKHETNWFSLGAARR